MAEWAHLPEDLLHRIATHIISSIDLLRFRSVCPSWRSLISSRPPHHSFPNRIPICTTNSPTPSFNSGYFHLSKRAILHLSLPETHQSHSEGWIIKLEQDVPHLSHLLNPLSESKIQPLPSNFPKTLNFLHLCVAELGQEYVLRYAEKCPYGFAGDAYREKVIFSSNSPWSSEIDYVILTIHVSGKLALFRMKDNVWSIIDDMPSPYDDVIRYKGDLYAVDSNGRAVVVVGPSLRLTEVANSVFGGDKKYLVEMDGELMLVDRYLSMGSEDYPTNYNQLDPNYEIYVPNDDTYNVDATVQFKVFKLEKDHWVEVKNLGDRVLFLGDNCSFSASASDFCGSKGNCIYFTDRFFRSNREEDGSFKDHCIGVFNMEDGRIGPLASYPGYSQLFWPPPVWVTSSDS